MATETYATIVGSVAAAGETKLAGVRLTDASSNVVMAARNVVQDANTDGAYAQVYVGAAGVSGSLSVNTEGTKATYRAAVAGVNIGTSATTDILTLTGSGTKAIRLIRMIVSGTIASTALNIDAQVIKRSAADTGGTATSITPVPVDSNDPAAQGTATYYTGVGPSVGTAVGVIAARKLYLPVTPAQADRLEFRFGDGPVQACVLHGTNEQAALNFGNITPANATSLDFELEWTAE